MAGALRTWLDGGLVAGSRRHRWCVKVLVGGVAFALEILGRVDAAWRRRSGSA